MRTKPPGFCPLFGKRALKRKGFNLAGFILGARGPRFKSGRPDQFPEIFVDSPVFSCVADRISTCSPKS